MEENKNFNNKNLIWRIGLKLFVKVSGWIVFPIILALFVGKSLDKHFGTSPWIFLGATGLAFLFSAYGIIKIAIKYAHEVEKENKDLWKKKNI